MVSHRTIDVEDGTVHVAQAGSPDKPAVLFLHGWPENWRSYEKIMELAENDYYAIAIDLPGIGDSRFSNAPFLKVEIAKVVHKIVSELGLRDIALVGHDIGGQIAFSYLQEYPNELRAAVILDVVIPGLNPWDEVLRNPYLWHFAFHAIPKLPEILVAGKQKEYFEYFYNAIAAHPEQIAPELKSDYVNAYSGPVSLSTGFNWYRGFAEDAKYNNMIAVLGNKIATPVLYMRGERSGGNMDSYVSGLAYAGLQSITAKVVHDCGHFMAVEQPNLVWKSIVDFYSQDK